MYPLFFFVLTGVTKLKIGLSLSGNFMYWKTGPEVLTSFVSAMLCSRADSQLMPVILWPGVGGLGGCRACGSWKWTFLLALNLSSLVSVLLSPEACLSFDRRRSWISFVDCRSYGDFDRGLDWICGPSAGLIEMLCRPIEVFPGCWRSRLSASSSCSEYGNLAPFLALLATLAFSAAVMLSPAKRLSISNRPFVRAPCLSGSSMRMLVCCNRMSYLAMAALMFSSGFLVKLSLSCRWLESDSLVTNCSMSRLTASSMESLFSLRKVHDVCAAPLRPIDKASASVW